MFDYPIINNIITYILSESTDKFVILKLVLTFISSFGTLIAAFAACYSAFYSRRSSSASFISILIKDYSTEQYLKSIQLLNSWLIKYDFVNKIIDIKHKNTKTYQKINISRRLLAHHFYNIYALRIGKMIDDKVLKLIMPIDKVEIARNIVEPFEAINNINYDKKPYDYFGNLYKIKMSNITKGILDLNNK